MYLGIKISVVIRVYRYTSNNKLKGKKKIIINDEDIIIIIIIAEVFRHDRSMRAPIVVHPWIVNVFLRFPFGSFANIYL